MGSGASVQTDAREENTGPGPSSAYLESLKNAQEGKSDKNVDKRFAIAPLRNSGSFQGSSTKRGSESADIHDGHLTTNKHILNVSGEGVIVHHGTDMLSVDDGDLNDDVVSTTTGSQFVFLPTGNNSNENLHGQFARPAPTNPRRGDVLYFVGAQDTT